MRCDVGEVTGVTGKLKSSGFYGVLITMQKVQYSFVRKRKGTLEVL